MRSIMVALAVCISVILSTAVEAKEKRQEVAQLVRQAIVPPVQGSMTDSAASLLSQGLMAIRGGMGKHVNLVLTNRLAREAMEVIAEKGNGWMKPSILLGIAVNESDLRWWLKSGYGTIADCGLTQINIASLSGMNNSKRRHLCGELRGKRKIPGGLTATKYSMQWTMKEMNTIKVKYCNPKWLARIKHYHQWTNLRKLSDKMHFWRCVLDVYNQGPTFITIKRNTCNYKWRSVEDGSRDGMAKRRRRCEARNRYWMRTLCFAEGIRLRKVPKYKRSRWTTDGRKTYYRRASCRRVWRYEQITGLYSY